MVPQSRIKKILQQKERKELKMIVTAKLYENTKLKKYIFIRFHII